MKSRRLLLTRKLIKNLNHHLLETFIISLRGADADKVGGRQSLCRQSEDFRQMVLRHRTAEHHMAQRGRAAQYRATARTPVVQDFKEFVIATNLEFTVSRHV